MSHLTTNTIQERNCLNCGQPFDYPDPRALYCCKDCKTKYNNHKRVERQEQRDLEVVEVISDLVEENTQLENHIEATEIQWSNIDILKKLFHPYKGESVCKIHLQEFIDLGFDFSKYDLKKPLNKNADFLIFERYELYLTENQFIILKRNS